MDTLVAGFNKTLENKRVIGFFPLPLSSVAIASAPHLSLGAEAMATDEIRGNPLCVGSRSGGCEPQKTDSDLIKGTKAGPAGSPFMKRT